MDTPARLAARGEILKLIKNAESSQIHAIIQTAYGLFSLLWNHTWVDTVLNQVARKIFGSGFTRRKSLSSNCFHYFRNF